MLKMGVNELLETKYVALKVLSVTKTNPYAITSIIGRYTSILYAIIISIREWMRADSLGDAEMFSKLDANHGFLQVEIDDGDPDKTTFTSNHRLFRSSRLHLECNMHLSHFYEQ